VYTKVVFIEKPARQRGPSAIAEPLVHQKYDRVNRQWKFFL